MKRTTSGASDKRVANSGNRGHLPQHRITQNRELKIRLQILEAEIPQ